MTESIMPQLRLFVVGETSGDPEQWCSLPHRAFVIAGSAEEAQALADIGGPAVEVSFEKAALLF